MVLKKALYCSVLALVLGNALCVSPEVTSEMSGKVRNLQISSPKISTEDQKLYKNLAPTLAIIKMFLKDDFKPLPEGLRDDVKTFFGKDEFTPNGLSCGGAQDIILDDELTDILCDLIEREQRESLKGNVTLYHGMTGSNLFVYKYFARLFSHLTGQDLGDCVLRGDHLYAKNPKTGKLFNTLQELRNFINAEHDYVRGMDISTLHCNIALSVGPGTSLSTASAVGFLCNSFSAFDYGISQLIVPALMFQGMPIVDAKKCTKEVENLFNKDFSNLGGGLLAISLSVEDINKLALHVRMGGEEYDPVMYSALYAIYDQFFMFFSDHDRNHTLCELMKIIKSISEDTSINEIEKKIDEAYLWIDDDKKESLAKQLKHFSGLRSSEHSSISYLLENLKNSLNKDLLREDVCNLTNEISLYLHPEMKATIFGTFCHPLPEKEAKSLDEEIDKLAASHANSIIKGNAKPADGAFVIPRKMAPNESLSYRIDLLPVFIERGMVSEAKQIINQYPDFLKNVDIARLVLSSVLKALYDGYDEVLEFIETNCGINNLLSEIPDDELYPFLHMFARKNANTAIGKLLKSSKIENDRILADLISGFLSSGYSEPDLSLTSVLEKKRLSQRVMEKVLSRVKFGGYDAQEVVEFFMKNGFSFNPKEKEGKGHLEKWLKICEENPKLSSSVRNILDFYGLDKEDYPQLSKFLDYEYNYEEEMKLMFYLESDEVDKEDKKSRIKELTPWDQFYKVTDWLDYRDKNYRSLGEELSREINYPGSAMTIFEAREMFKKYVL